MTLFPPVHGIQARGELTRLLTREVASTLSSCLICTMAVSILRGCRNRQLKETYENYSYSDPLRLVCDSDACFCSMSHPPWPAACMKPRETRQISWSRRSRLHEMGNGLAQTWRASSVAMSVAASLPGKFLTPKTQPPLVSSRPFTTSTAGPSNLPRTTS